MKKLVSVIIRTLNEEKYLDELLNAIFKQSTELYDIEVVIVDSGSSDRTINIAKSFNCRITNISKEQFTFGRSLNVGCEYSRGDFLVFISGHCIPVNNDWLNNLVVPLEDKCAYTYGRQIGRDTTKFSEMQLFNKYYPIKSRLPQDGFFCNNANSSLSKATWEKHKFDESLTGLEDMELAKRLVASNLSIGYIAEAPVYHIHDESWRSVRIRYEREANALKAIMPEIEVSFFDALKYILVSIIGDSKKSLIERSLVRNILSIILFRASQYIGSYRGNRITTQVSKKLKYRYFYPLETDLNLHEPKINKD